jgi:hypothetical protein
MDAREMIGDKLIYEKREALNCGEASSKLILNYLMMMS